MLFNYLFKKKNTFFFNIMIFKYIVLALYWPYIYYLQKSKKSLQEIHFLLKNKICGKTAFNTMISVVSPYSGSINPVVEEFDSNITKCYIHDNNSLRNPFNSIHALALANLGELTSGLLMMNHLQFNKQRGIITKISIEYYKKAKGKITSICHIDSLKNGVIKCQLFDVKQVLIGEVFCTWDIKKNDI